MMTRDRQDRAPAVRRVAVLALLAAVGCGGGGASGPSGPADDPAAQPETPVPPAPPEQPPTPVPPGLPGNAVFDTPDKYFTPSEVTIAAGGTVTWLATDNSHEIHFDGSAPPGGDIGFLKEGQSATRTFPTPGTYRFLCDRHDDVGVIHVGTATEPPPPDSSVVVTTPGVTFSPAVVTINAGTAVRWQFTGIRHNVTFRGVAPQGGSIPDTEPGNAVSRTFIAPGTYEYDCTRHQGMSGRVVVR